jgi:hypothetical protein
MMLEPVGNLPFAITPHKLAKALERAQLDLMLSYDRFGAHNTGLQPQGQIVDMEV